MTEENKKEIEKLKKNILDAEKALDAAKNALHDLTGEDLPAYESATPHKRSLNPTVSGGKVIEGIFNGENMVGPEGKLFPVPANYASKSKLVEGDRLKLTVAEDGAFIFKQIGPVERKNVVGDLVFEDNAYHVNADGKRYNLLYAAVTYHKAKPGDRVTIVVPATGDSVWAAFENVIHNVVPVTDNTVSEMLDLDIPGEKEVADLPPASIQPVTPAPDTSLDVSAVSELPQPPEVPDPVTPKEPVTAPDPAPVAPAPAPSGIQPVGTLLADATYDDTEDTTNSLGEKVPGDGTVSDLEI